MVQHALWDLLVSIEDVHDLGLGRSPPMLPAKTMYGMPMAWAAASMGRNTEITRATAGGPPRRPDGPGQRDRDRTGDGQAAGSVAVADQGATPAQQDIAAASAPAARRPESATAVSRARALTGVAWSPRAEP